MLRSIWSCPFLATVFALLLACGGAEGELVGGPGEEGEAEEALDTSGWPLVPGVNGDACRVSPYNCKLRVTGGNRVLTNDPDDDNAWSLMSGGLLRDGNGDGLAVQTNSRATFNHGQTRKFAGELHAFSVSSSNGSAGWFPISKIHGKDSFLRKVGHVLREDSGLAELGCYAIRNWHDPSIELKKVVRDSRATHERAGDYLPLVRNNGRRSANLVFNVPGFGLGGVAVDHFPAGTKFRRLKVPTATGRPSIDIPLWVKDSEGRYRQQSGTMKFIYGYIIAHGSGTRRVGWMSYDALEVSSGCP